jgi:nuclear pore complex protein Nup205
MDNPEAHRKFFELMLSVLRIVNAIVLNYRTDQTLASSLEFLTENRQSVVGILKRFARVGGINADGGIDLSDLVDNLSLLISATDFLTVGISSTLFCEADSTVRGEHAREEKGPNGNVYLRD